MDERWKSAIEDFERVWPRVNPDPPPPPPPHPGRPGPPPPPPEREDTQALKNLIEDEAEAEMLYSALSRMTRGKASDALRSLAASSRRLMRRLQEEYAFLTGDTLPLPKRPPRISSPREGIRLAWERAGKQEDAFRRFSGDTRNRELRSLAGNAAEVKERQRRRLRELGRRFF
ncbi:MAG: hypothetical protein IJ705_02475 [Oscillospiraceae bacterium]|nr:hypothetical protein [Oscillospiraceae bacterium]